MFLSTSNLVLENVSASLTSSLTLSTHHSALSTILCCFVFLGLRDSSHVQQKAGEEQSARQLSPDVCEQAATMKRRPVAVFLCNLLLIHSTVEALPRPTTPPELKQLVSLREALQPEPLPLVSVNPATRYGDRPSERRVYRRQSYGTDWCSFFLPPH